MEEVLRPKMYKLIGLLITCSILFLAGPYIMLTTGYVPLFSFEGVVLVIAFLFGFVGFAVLVYKMVHRITLIIGPKGIYTAFTLRKQWLTWKDIKTIDYIDHNFKWPLWLGPTVSYLTIKLKNPKKYHLNEIISKKTKQKIVKAGTMNNIRLDADIYIPSDLLPSMKETVTLLKQAQKKYTK